MDNITLACSLTLKMEAICSSEFLGALQTAWRYNPEDFALRT